MSLESRDTVRLWASRSEDWACLVIEDGETYCEIRLARVHVETLRDHLPGVLAGLDRWAAEDAACEKAEISGRRATDLAAQALDLAVAAEAAEAHELATSLRSAVAEATAKANAVDAAVQAFGHAAADADYASEVLIYATRETEQALGRLQDDDRPAEVAAP
jgi:hypothetical protein